MRSYHGIVILALLTLTLAGIGCSGRSGPIDDADALPEDQGVVEPSGEVRTDPAQEGSVEELDSEPFREEGLREEDVADSVVTIEDEIAEGREVLEPVYFEFDSHDLTSDALRALEANHRWLLAHPTLRVIIEGHCDERGTIEYNIDLGAKRAKAVRDHLTRLGLPAGRIETISYGEERPADPGRTESAWAKNRRAEFELEKP